MGIGIQPNDVLDFKKKKDLEKNPPSRSTADANQKLNPEKKSKKDDIKLVVTTPKDDSANAAISKDQLPPKSFVQKYLYPVLNKVPLVMAFSAVTSFLAYAWVCALMLGVALGWTGPIGLIATVVMSSLMIVYYATNFGEPFVRKTLKLEYDDKIDMSDYMENFGEKHRFLYKSLIGFITLLVVTGLVDSFAFGGNALLGFTTISQMLPMVLVTFLGGIPALSGVLAFLLSISGPVGVALFAAGILGVASITVGFALLYIPIAIHNIKEAVFVVNWKQKYSPYQIAILSFTGLIVAALWFTILFGTTTLLMTLGITSVPIIWGVSLTLASSTIIITAFSKGWAIARLAFSDQIADTLAEQLNERIAGAKIKEKIEKLILEIKELDTKIPTATDKKQSKLFNKQKAQLTKKRDKLIKQRDQDIKDRPKLIAQQKKAKTINEKQSGLSGAIQRFLGNRCEYYQPRTRGGKFLKRLGQGAGFYAATLMGVPALLGAISFFMIFMGVPLLPFTLPFGLLMLFVTFVATQGLNTDVCMLVMSAFAKRYDDRVDPAGAQVESDPAKGNVKGSYSNILSDEKNAQASQQTAKANQGWKSKLSFSSIPFLKRFTQGSNKLPTEPTPLLDNQAPQGAAAQSTA